MNQTSLPGSGVVHSGQTLVYLSKEKPARFVMSVHTRNGHDPGHITTMLSCSEGSVDHFICLADALNGVILLVVRLTSIFYFR